MSFWKKRTLAELLSGGDWILLPGQSSISDFDEPTKTLRASMLRAYKGYMCALCKTSSCDDSWDLLLQITGKGADGNVTFSPYVICKSCTGKHSGSGLAALGRQGRINMTVRVG